MGSPMASLSLLSKSMAWLTPLAIVFLKSTHMFFNFGPQVSQFIHNATPAATNKPIATAAIPKGLAAIATFNNHCTAVVATVAALYASIKSLTLLITACATKAAVTAAIAGTIISRLFFKNITADPAEFLSLIHISEPTRLGMIS